MKSICLLVFLWIVLCHQWVPGIYGEEIMTPIVTINDINPDAKSGRVVMVTSTLSRVDAIMGENIIFECSVVYLQPGKQILWKFMINSTSITLNDGLKSLDSSKYRISQGTSQVSIRLEIMSVGYSSAGVYLCEVFYDDRSTEIRRSRQLDIYELPRFQIQDTSFETTASVGDAVTLTCSAIGAPQPRLYWLRSAGSSSVIRDYGRQVEGGVITFTAVQAADRGTYICNAINRIGTSQWPVRLTVNFKPSVRFESGATASQKVGCTLELLCVIEANPVPNERDITVTQNGNIIQDNVNGVRLFYMRGADSTIYYSVFINPFKASGAGSYVCTARNTVKDGTGSASVQVSTSDVPVPGRSGTPVCGVGGAPAGATAAASALTLGALAATAARCL